MTDTFSGPSVPDEWDSSIAIEHAYDEETPPSIAIVEAIAHLENADPMALPRTFEMTLYDHVDPAALDRLVTGRSEPTEITIELDVTPDRQYAVRIHETGEIVVEKPV